MKRKWPLVAILGVVFVGCILGAFSCVSAIIRIMQEENQPRCSPPVGGFSKSNLVGTWVAGDPKHSDTLLIKPDGAYKQIVHVEFPRLPPIDYESGWQPWYLEYSIKNIPYLHLRGYAFCGMNVAIPCGQRDGGGYDFCQDRSIQMLNEGILLVLESSEQKPGTREVQYYYHLTYPLGSENSYSYRLQEP
jgi:hypothetical protein